MEDVQQQKVDPNKQVFPHLKNESPQFPFIDSTKSENSASDITFTSSEETGKLELPFLIGAQSSSEVKATDNIPSYGGSTKFKTKKLKLQQMGHRSGREDFSLQKESNLNPMPYQKQNFRSSTAMKMVPLVQRFRTNNPLSVRSPQPFPLIRPKFVPYHSRQFLWKEEESTIQKRELEIMESFQKEEEKKLSALKGHKRKIAVPKHRKEFNDLHVGGKPPTMEEKTKPCGIHKRYVWQIQMRPLANLPASAPSSNQNQESSEEVQKPHAENKATPNDSFKNVTEVHSHRKVQKQQKLISSGKDSQDFKVKERSLPNISRIKDNQSLKLRSNSEINFTTYQKKNKQVRKQSVDDAHAAMHAGIYHNKAKNQIDIPHKYTKSTYRRTTNVKRVSTERASTEKVSKNEEQMKIEEEALDTTHDLSDQEENEEEEEIMIVEEALLKESDSKDTMSDRPSSGTEVEMLPETTPPGIERTSTPNPLRIPDLNSYLPEDRLKELENLFKNLDSDKDGHLMFREVETAFPEGLTRNQKKFIKEVYEVVSSSTYFGLSEFCTISLLCEQLMNLSPELKQAMEDVKSHILQEAINEFIVEFMKVDCNCSSLINAESLKIVLEAVCGFDVGDVTLSRVLQGMGKNQHETINKLDLLVAVPYLLQFKS